MRGTPRNQRSPRDPARVVRLLWQAPAAPGRSGLSLAAIVGAATALADAEGIEAVSMRRVADELGAATMSIYTHVPGRSELVELMVDGSVAGLYDAGRPPGEWRAGLEFVARRNWDLYLAHPWLLDVILPRPVLGPHTIAKYDAELAPMEGSGLTDLEMDSVLTLVLTHVAGAARSLAGVARAERETGLTEQQWWEKAGPALDAVYPAAGWPVATRVGAAAGEAYGAGDPRHALDFGLARILDGVAALVSRRSAEAEGG